MPDQPMSDQPMSDHPTTGDSIAAVDAAITGRRTLKVFADPAYPFAIPTDFVDRLQPALEVAGMAPFHYACHASHRGATAVEARGEGGAIEPWRVYLLDAASCRTLIGSIRDEAEDRSDPIWRDAPGSKIPRMLAAAGALALLCWLPDPPDVASGSSSPTRDPAMQESTDIAARREAEREKRNREHLAAAAAYGQSLLIAATARGLASYWSSGGVLATERALNLCGIPAGQPLLGALFFFPQPTPDAEYVTGKLRPLRSPSSGWLHRVHLG